MAHRREARVLAKTMGSDRPCSLDRSGGFATPGQFLDAGTYGWGLKARDHGPVAREN